LQCEQRSVLGFLIDTPTGLSADCCGRVSTPEETEAPPAPQLDRDSEPHL